MATPQPETGGPLSSRTTAEPPRPLGQAASGEKDLLRDLRPSDVRQADIRSPVVRTPEPPPLSASVTAKPVDAPVSAPSERPQVKPAERPPIRPPERSAVATPERSVSAPLERPAAAIPERPLARPPLRPAGAAPAERGPAKPIERPTPEPATRTQRPAAAPAPTAKDWGLAPAQRSGSFTGWVVAGVLLIGTAAGGYFAYTEFYRPSADGAATNEADAVATKPAELPAEADDELLTDADDPFDNTAAASPKAKRSGSAPRLAKHTTKAIPIQNATKQTGGTRTKKAHPLADDAESTLELPLDLDEPAEEMPSLASEPPEEDPSEPPLLRVPQQPSDSRATARSGAERKVTHDAAEPEEDDLGDFTISDERPATTKGQSGKGPKFSMIEAQNERESAGQLDDFEPEDGNRRRAVAKTVIVRSENAPAVPKSPTDDDGWVADDSRPAARSPVSRSARADSTTPPTKIQPRGATHATAGAVPRELRPLPEAARHSDTYTVVPSDNFWTISRKQYGSGRYYAALARHNQERIPDPQRMRPGMQVSTPPAALLEERYPELIDKAGATPAPATSQTIPGDNRPRFSAPASIPVTAEKPAAASSAGYFHSKSGEPLYRIGSDDTLGSIAQRHLGRYSRWTEIYEQNRDILKNPENLTVGTVIRLPPDASRVGLAPEVELRR